MLYLCSFSMCPDPGCHGCSILICSTVSSFLFVSLPHTGDACNHGLIVLGCKVEDACFVIKDRLSDDYDLKCGYTSFDAYLSTSQVGITESFMVLSFYMYGGIYSLFSGENVDNISVNFYGPDGNLIRTANSSEMG